MDKHFLLCSERSGSNLITKMLNAHSQICGPSTKHLMNPVYRNLFRYTPLNDDKNWEQLIKDLLNLYNVEFSVWKSEFSLDELKKEIPKGDYVTLINYFFDKETSINGKKMAFIKENHIYEFFPYLYKYYPESKFIYQVRDPRDVALSWKKNPTHKGGVVNAAIQWKKDQQQLLKLCHFLETENRVIKLKYEDLITDSTKELKRIFEFLNLEYESKVEEFYKDSLTKENATTQHAWNNLSKSVITDNSNKFKKELTDVEIQVIEKICFFEMKSLGYQLINSSDELKQLTEVDIQNLEKEETSISYSPSKGVKENMIAKAAFYQR